MKFVSLLSLIALPGVIFAFPATTEVSDLSEHVTSNKITGLTEPNGVVGITLCTSPGFSGCTNYAVNTDICYTIPELYASNTHSSRSSSGAVCFMYTNDNCSSCETCLDAVGWSNMNFAPVRSLRCVYADAQGCSNANCRHH